MAKADQEAAQDAVKAQENADAEEQGISATVTKTGECECVIKVEADAEYLQKRYDEEFVTLQKDLALPGFRRGKAPQGLVERKLGEKLKTDTLSKVLEESFQTAVRENDLKVVAELESPDVEGYSWAPGKTAEFEFKCEILPDLHLEQSRYKGVKIEAPALTASEEMVQRELDRFAERFKVRTPVEGSGIDREDEVEVELAVSLEGPEDWIRKATFRPADERIGPFVVEGIVGSLLGVEAGEELEVTASWAEGAQPQRFGLAQYAGKEVPLRLKILNVYRVKIPEISDELAQKIGLENAEDIRTMVRKGLEKDIEARKRQVAEYVLLSEILDAVPFQMPPSLVAGAAQDRIGRSVVQQIRSGVPRQEAERRAEDQAERSREEAERDLKITYLLKTIADQERIYVEESEVQEQIRAIAARQKWTEQKAQRYLEEQDMQRSLREEMREAKTRKLLMDEAKIEEIDPEEFESWFAEKYAKLQKDRIIVP